jgi:hypothetical protein
MTRETICKGRQSAPSFTPAAVRDTFVGMSTITAILEPDADGTLHLPLPIELRKARIRVKAQLEPVSAVRPRAKAGLWKGMPDRFWMAADFDAPLEDFREYME